MICGALSALADSVQRDLHLLDNRAAPSITTHASPPLDIIALGRPTAAADRHHQKLWRTRILTILRDHWQPSEQDPDYLLEDLHTLADYFSRYPKVRELFATLEQGKWRWHHKAKTAKTRVVGSRLQVQALEVHFDSRAAAQLQFQHGCRDKLPFCVAAPADVLLHELLHVYTVLQNPAEFMRQGGMNTHIYPHLHEQHTIALERALYQSMTAIDGVPRPQRHEHRGRPLQAACSTCLQ